MRYALVVATATITSGLLVAGIALAKPITNRIKATNTHANVTVTIPEHAVEIAPDIFSLGTAVVDGKVVEGLMIIDRRAPAKPDGVGNGNGKRGGGGNTKSNCYAYLAKGAKWKVIEPWVVNPANSHGLADSFVFENTAANIQKWEDSAGADIFGNGITTSDTLVVDTNSPDSLNEVLFGTIDSPGAIAVTIVWGIFGGPPKGRELVEWDQVYDDKDYGWSATGEAGEMDFENISTHEVGHALGMGHPDLTCADETMHRYADYGETIKRDLNAGDITGIKGLY